MPHDRPNQMQIRQTYVFYIKVYVLLIKYDLPHFCLVQIVDFNYEVIA